MSQGIPEVSVPTGNSRFNAQTGEGFALWFAALKSTISVSLLEARNQAITAAASALTGATAALRQEVAEVSRGGKQYTDETIHRAINVTGLAMDADGTPYFSPGSMNPRVLADTDGTPYFREL